MLIKSRSFTRRLPTREARSVYIFCEGRKREYQYFRYFREIDSRINIEIYKLGPSENNSPEGLLEIANRCFTTSDYNPSPKYSFETGDEVWIIFDTDKDKCSSRAPQIEKIKDVCSSRSGWFCAQSNPCFEVWLYYHFCFLGPVVKSADRCSEWKSALAKLEGGFDSKRHPVLIQDATIIAEKNYSEDSGNPRSGCTEIYRLSKSILPLIKDKLDRALSVM